MASVEQHEIWYCHCPLKCKGTSKLGSWFENYEAASAKVIWHLQHSEKHYMSEDDATQALLDNTDCVWAEQVDAKYYKQLTSVPDKPKQGSSSGSGNPRRGSGSDGNQVARRRDRSRSRESAGRDRQLTLVPPVQQQKQAVYNFARVLGKCEAVIRTAARVARQAALAFEVELALFKMLLFACRVNFENFCCLAWMSGRMQQHAAINRPALPCTRPCAHLHFYNHYVCTQCVI